MRLSAHRHHVATVARVRLEGVQSAGCSDEEIDKITWQNASRFFDWDPFFHTPRDQANVGALRARASDVDTSVMSRQEWRLRNEAAGIGMV